MKILKKLKRFISWKKFKNELKVRKCTLYERVMLASILFDDLNKPEVGLRRCSKFYIKPVCSSLHTMLSELDTAVEEYGSKQVIASRRFDYLSESIRLDTWCFTLQDSPYSSYDLYDCYIHATEQILKINSLTVTEPTKSYVARKLHRVFDMYVIIAQVLGEFKYEYR